MLHQSGQNPVKVGSIVKVNFDAGPTVIFGTGTSTILIPLGQTGFTYFTGKLYNKENIADSGRRRRACTMIEGTTDINDGIGLGSRLTNFVVSLYNFTDWGLRGFRYDIDGRISDNHLASINSIQIQSARIVGSDVELVLENPSGINSTFDFRGSLTAFK